MPFIDFDMQQLHRGRNLKVRLNQTRAAMGPPSQPFKTSIRPTNGETMMILRRGQVASHAELRLPLTGHSSQLLERTDCAYVAAEEKNVEENDRSIRPAQ